MARRGRNPDVCRSRQRLDQPVSRHVWNKLLHPLGISDAYRFRRIGRFIFPQSRKAHIRHQRLEEYLFSSEMSFFPAFGTGNSLSMISRFSSVLP